MQPLSRALQCSQIRIKARQFLCPGRPALKGLFQSYRLCRPYGSCIANGRVVPYMQVGPRQSIVLECTFGAVAMAVDISTGLFIQHYITAGYENSRPCASLS